MRHYGMRNKAFVLFISLQTVLYAVFLILDIRDTDAILSRNIKYAVIILCFCYALFFAERADKSIVFCVRAGLFFTMISDLFLLMIDKYTCGILTFIIVQQLYGIRIILTDSRKTDEHGLLEVIWEKHIRARLAVRLVIQLGTAIIIIAALLWAGVAADALLIISIFYFVCILTNTVTSLRSAVHEKSKPAILFAVGMCLFLLCDINVGLFNLSGFIRLPEELYHFFYNAASFLMWVFYAPSQILIALSITVPANSTKNIKKFM